MREIQRGTSGSLQRLSLGIRRGMGKDMKPIKVSSKPEKCPKCGGKVLDILYGMPMDEAVEAYERGEIILGGCCIQIDGEGNSLMPDWQCKKCNAQFIEE